MSKTFYHVVTDRPMAAGQKIIFDDTHHSGVYQRVMALADTAADVCAHPEKYEFPLPHHLDVAIRELALEKIRLEKFPQYPSRMACLYVSRELEEARRWGEYFARIGRPTYAIVEIRTNGRVFCGDACNCFDGTGDQAENLQKAEHYWLNLPNEDGEPIYELIIDGELEIVRIVEEINANIP